MNTNNHLLSLLLGNLRRYLSCAATVARKFREGWEVGLRLASGNAALHGRGRLIISETNDRQPGSVDWEFLFSPFFRGVFYF